MAVRPLEINNPGRGGRRGNRHL